MFFITRRKTASIRIKELEKMLSQAWDENERLRRRVSGLEGMLESTQSLRKAIDRQSKEIASLRNLAIDVRLHLQNILTELKEAKRDGRDVSTSRIRREIKKVLRWYHGKAPDLF